MTEQEFDERVRTYGRIAHNAANEARPDLEKSVDVLVFALALCLFCKYCLRKKLPP